ncbi:hypothetical protein [Clostridium massiliamazoniense]|uniref:hypothetical protein n=1 Tax=Clostridium massiliamazoniense TaxID=1347366 RepID=UPI0006D782EC|nr:hypothetical protein [Clostridium massiliamazoniense]
MDYVKNPYLLVMPEGKAFSVPDIEYVRAYVVDYYDKKSKAFSSKEEFSYYDINDDEVRDEMLITIGNNDGRPILYDMKDFLEKLRESEVFQDDFDEILSIMQKKHLLDIKKYELENVLVNSKVVEFDY